jgi:prepilin-type N-terminal cleavage/methylation domain-containing protein
MRISSVGRANKGVTLLELLVVMVIIAVLAGVTYPSLTSGIDTLRLNAAAQTIVTFLNSGLNRAERRQEGVEITVAKSDNSLTMRSTDPNFMRKLEMPEGITIDRILPEYPTEQPGPRVFMVYPGGTVPRIGISVVNRRGVERLVQVDPMTGIPQVSDPKS